MPKGYPNKFAQLNQVWSPEMDEHLTMLVGQGKTYRECTPLMNARFPGKEWTRSAIIGRAGRIGLHSKNPKYIHNGPRMRVSRKGMTYKTKKTKAVNVRSVLDARHASMPAAVRTDEENVLGVSHAIPRTRASREDIAKRKLGFIPEIVNADKPKTSKLISECTGNECRWPTSSDILCMEVCGAPSTYGAYCEEHGSRAYRVGMTNRRNASYHREQREHTVRLHHELNTADQSVIPSFLMIDKPGTGRPFNGNVSQQDLEDCS